VVQISDFLYMRLVSPILISRIFISPTCRHVGGLEYVGFSTKFDPKWKPNLYLSKELAGQLWNNTLSGGMRSIEGDSKFR